jgi:hypothetical protein
MRVGKTNKEYAVTLIFTLYVAGGALLTAISVPLIQKRIPPNPWYGFRVPQTLNDPDV